MDEISFNFKILRQKQVSNYYRISIPGKIPVILLDEPGFGWIRGFERIAKKQERQGVLYLTTL